MRFQGVPPEELQQGEEEIWEPCTAMLVNAIMCHPDNNRLIAELEERT